MNDYSDEFKKVSGLNSLKFQFRDANGKTTWMNLNQDSVDALVEFLHKEGFSVKCN